MACERQRKRWNSWLRRREQSRASDVTFEVHALVQDAYDFDAGYYRSIEDEMAAHRVLEITLANFVANSPKSRRRCERLNHPLNSTDILLGLCCIPAPYGVVPNFIEVRSGSAR